MRKDSINSMIDLETSATTETKSKPEEERKTLDENISVLGGKLADFLPIALCHHNSKSKAVKRTAEPVIIPAKFTAKASNNSKNNNKNSKEEFVFPKKTSKSIPIKEIEKLEQQILLQPSTLQKPTPRTSPHLRIK
ncbi:hypothetical protein TNCV_3295501 [Trichonephila clavipes]|uniref:Uncharacterized protein n=1 Tax=Trichonephila clavipes TaxID=2585209 RepID=A0A8X6T759_TRICX|nr:hypothetical protein TNCV_3295501 [Trichonephila clavipes]